jgi:hypothetical protein
MDGLLVYAGISHGGYLYYRITSLDENNGESAAKLPTHSYNEKLFKGRPGAIYPVIFKDERTVSFNKKEIPVGWWENRNDVIEWQTRTDAADLQAKKERDMSKMISQNAFQESLQPIKTAYDSASRDGRLAIVANIISFLNK